MEQLSNTETDLKNSAVCKKSMYHFADMMMSLTLNMGNWWECSGDEIYAINLRQSSLLAQGDEYHRRGENQALISISSRHKLIKNRFHCGRFDRVFLQILFRLI